MFLVAPNLHLSGLSWLAKAVSVAYPLGDVLLLAARSASRSTRASARRPSTSSSTSIVCLLATDCAYNYALLAGTYNHQLIYDLGWMRTTSSGAPRHSTRRCGCSRSPRPTRALALTSIRLALLGAACLIAPSIRFAQ